MATSDEDREAMVRGLAGLRRVRKLLPGNTDVDLGISAIGAALGSTVPQRTAAQVLGVSHPELSELISRRELAVEDTTVGRAQVVVESLVELLEAREGAVAVASESAAPRDVKDDLARMRKLRDLAFHRALARNLSREAVDQAKAELATRRAVGELSGEIAVQWEEALDLPITDLIATMTEQTPRGEALRENSPFSQ